MSASRSVNDFNSPGRETVHADGTFELTGLSGVRRINVGGMPRGWNVKSITRGGRDMTDTGYEFKGTEEVDGFEILLTARTTDVSGRVVDTAGAEVSEYFVLVFRVDERTWRPHRTIRGTRPDQRGAFHMPSLPAGEYYIIAFNDMTPNDVIPSMLDRLSRGAQKFHLGDGESKTLIVKLTRAAQ